ncbi:MAG: type II secretion system secretin GspD [Thermodesulfobacteriota bacterium]
MNKHQYTILILFLLNLLLVPPSYTQIIIDTDGPKDNVIQLLSYTIQDGDSLTVLADRFLIPVKELQQINNIDGTVIKTGQTLLIPIISYKVREGDSLLGLAAKNRIPVKDIRHINNIEGNTIKIGQTIYIPKRASSFLLTSFTKEVSAQEIPDEEIEVDGDVIDSKFVQEGPDEQTDVAENVNSQQENTLQDNKEEAVVVEEAEVDNEPDGRPTFEVVVPQPTSTVSNNNEQDDIVNLQSEMELKDLIQTMSEISSEAFILDDSVKGKKVTIIAPQGGFKRKNAIRLFETILDLNGFSIVSKQGVNKIVQKKDIKTQSIPTDVSTTLGISSDRYITKIISLKNVKADELSKALKSLISKEGDLVVYSASNKLIIVDTVDNINRIVEIISNLDVEKRIEFIQIENADAADVATKLLEIFGAESRIRSTQPRTSGRSTRQGRANQASTSQQASVTGESEILGFKVITDERTNSLIIIAYPQDMEKIRKVISILDVLSEQVEQGIYVLRIKNADAEQIVGVLSSIIGSGGGGGRVGGQQNQRARLSSGGLGSTQTGIGSGQTRAGLSRQAASGALSSVVAEADGLRITADPATNSVIIVGSRRDYESIKTVIDELDIRRKQVFVEAAILEVGLNDLTALGVNFSFGATLNGDNLIFGGQQLPGVQSLLGIAADSDAAINIVGSLQGLFLGVVGEEIDVDGSGPIPPIPSFTALFQAISSVTDVNVLSTPSILTTDNEQAEIVVADIIPFPTGSTIGTSGVTVQTIERLPVGIRLAITPQISEGKYMNLNIVTEVSNTTPAPEGLNTEDFGIATQTRTADSSVIVRDGQTIVIGGLVSDRESIVEQKTPILGDIPYLGNLFKFKSKQSQKLNLMILLTPRIVETDADMQQILEEQQRRKTLLQERGLDVLEESKY